MAVPMRAPAASAGTPPSTSPQYYTVSGGGAGAGTHPVGPGRGSGGAYLGMPPLAATPSVKAGGPAPAWKTEWRYDSSGGV